MEIIFDFWRDSFMKKALALVMALAMVMSMALVSMANTVIFAADSDDIQASPLAKFDEEIYIRSKDKMISKDRIHYGATAYLVPLFVGYEEEDGDEVQYDYLVTDDRTVSDLSIKAEWEEGGEYIKSIEFVKKSVRKFKYAEGYTVDYGSPIGIYLLAIKTTGYSVDDNDVEGTIYLKGKSGSKIDGKYTKIDGYIDVAFTLGYHLAEYGEDYDDNEADVTSDDFTVYDFSDIENDEYTIVYDEFIATVNVKREENVILALDTDIIEEIYEAFPNANIDYYTLTGYFKRVAKVCVELENGKEFLYQVVDGKIVEVNGEYDEWTEEFTFKTRNLGTYIISDVKLDIDSFNAVRSADTAVSSTTDAAV